jgi:hypothetical protein
LGRGAAQRLSATAFAALALMAPGALADTVCSPDLALLETPQGRVQFHVEIADDGAERSQGLMNRENLARSAGMLFVYEEPVEVGFWMKNTLIPLDMIFIDESGAVISVHANARPHDLTPIDSGGPVRFVLEINGGLSQKLGIAPGTLLAHPAVEPSLARLPCE